MNSWVNICSMELRWTERCRGALRTRVHASSHARWSANTPWVDVKTIAGVVAHIQRERRRGQTPTPDAVCALSSEASLPVRGNKHLSCANSSVKCTNCGGEADVSAGVTALGLEAMSEPGISCSAPPTPNASTPPFSPSWTPALAEGHSGNYYLLDVCLISSHSSRWPSQGHGGMCWPPPPTPCVITSEGPQWQNNLWPTFRSFIQRARCQPRTKLPTFMRQDVPFVPLPSGWPWMRTMEGAAGRMSKRNLYKLTLMLPEALPLSGVKV